MMVSLGGSKALLAFFNFLLLVCGCTLIIGGVIILLDPGRVLLSRLLSHGPLTTLPHPLLYYLALGFAVVGLVLATAGLLGCWASCLYSYCMLTTYFVLILLVMVGECAAYAAAWIWPQCMGLGVVADELVKSMQRNYGAAGQEQFTAAIDLLQTSYSCCGIVSSVEYDTSLWRLQALGPSLAVPLTCCKLDNYNHPAAYLDPHPVNSSLCQALETSRQQGYRHSDGCGQHLQDWFKQQYILFLAVGLLIVLVEFTVLLSTILACTKLYKYRHELKETHVLPAVGNDSGERRHRDAGSNSGVKAEFPSLTKDDDLYVTSRASRLPYSFSNHAYTLSNSFRQNYRLATGKA
ncbi:tetraspanin-18B isoform X1 [Atheta coriaria]|uniref:tetraspanin-18B isoform X1 n=1 Tax=Dalotia coriaria TaxID=877792 RepID=UPI0031F3EF5E